jgi:hypothetical protein
MNHKECDLLFKAGKALILESRLVKWNGFEFEPLFDGNCDCDFEAWLKGAYQHEYGRYISWVLFSVGMENLAKAACVCRKALEKDANGKYGTLSQVRQRGISIYKGDVTDPKLVKDFRARWEKLEKIRNDEAHAFYIHTRRKHYRELEPHLIPLSNDLVKILRDGDHFGEMNNA